MGGGGWQFLLGVAWLMRIEGAVGLWVGLVLLRLSLVLIAKVLSLFLAVLLSADRIASWSHVCCGRSYKQIPPKEIPLSIAARPRR